MPEIIDRYAAAYFTLNSLSDKRRLQVTAALHRLDDWLDKPVELATDADLRAWMVELLQEDELQASTVGWYLKAVAPFYRWCWTERVIEPDVWMRINAVKAPRGSQVQLPKPYTRRELGQFWAAIDEKYPYTTYMKLKRWNNGTGRWRSVRKHAMRLQVNAMVELALVCGLRRAEIYNLSIDDMHWDNQYVVVHGKRVDQHDKVREVPYPDSAREAVQKWLRFRLRMGPKAGARVWLSVTGPDPVKPLVLKRMQLAVLIGGDWRFHRLRHTCATERLRAGMELENLKEFLGHAHISQTLAYAQLIREDIHRSSERIDADFQRAIRPAA